MSPTTYPLLCAMFLVAALLVAGAAAVVRRRVGGRRGATVAMLPAAGLAAVVLLMLTAVFDNLMIAAGLFSYAEDVISGVRLGLAPVEDFAYPVAAAILLPALWVLLEPATSRRRSDDR